MRASIKERGAVRRRGVAIRIEKVALLVGVVILAGCTSGMTPPFGAGTPVYDRQFGESVRQAIADQTLGPGAAARNSGKTTQLDGTAAKNASDRYHDSFKEPPPTFTVLGAPVQNVGGGQ